jgi:hypothetical protein
MAEAEFERELIRERAAAGLKRYQQDYGAGRVGKETRSRSGKNLPVGRPRRVFDRHTVAQLRNQGLSYCQIASRLGLGEGTVRSIHDPIRDAPKPCQPDSMSDRGSTGFPSSQDGPPNPQGCGAKRKPQTRAELPRAIRKELATFARKLARDHRALFASDPIYRKRAGQFLTALLPPKSRRRGRPGRSDVTQAIRLLRQFRRRHPEERAVEHWQRVYPLAIPTMPP